MIVLDTNIVLDAFVFCDPATLALRQGLQQNHWQWIATSAMRDELERVLAYPKIIARLAQSRISSTQVMAHFDAQATLLDAPAKAAPSCRDPDDQKFIDLAVAHHCVLLSKDKAVLCLAKRLLALGVTTRQTVTLQD